MTCVVIGSGPSGTHAALTLLGRGCNVELWDVGRDDSHHAHPDVDFHGLKGALPEPQRHFLGARFEALLGPDSGELLKYPPSRNFLLQADEPYWPFAATKFAPFISFARGGLAVGWGANALSYDDDDLRGWPVSFSDLRSAYATICSRIAIAGVSDQLSCFFPGVKPNQPAAPLAGHEAALFERARVRARALELRCGITLGRSRLAVTMAADDSRSCRLCGRCLWGCPHGSLYSPAETTLRECQRYAGFRYVPGRLVLAFEAAERRVRSIHFLDIANGRRSSARCTDVFLAAGALQSGAIFLRTLKADATLRDGEISTAMTQSVMDTAVVRVPYIQLRRIGAPAAQKRLQCNTLIMAHRVGRPDGWPTYCHGQVLSLPPLLYHRLIESIPLGSRAAVKLFKSLGEAIGAVTYFFPDKQGPGNGLALMPDARSPTGDLIEVRYSDCTGKSAIIDRTLTDTQRALRMLGCVASRPIRGQDGAGIHYAGTIPMGAGPKCCDRTGRSNLYRNLYICDGAAFPTLPSKSITLNLMAHAVRVAELSELH